MITTLGYGDVTPVARWRLLGPMTAMNGVLLFGWSTAVIFQGLRRTTACEEGGVQPQTLTPSAQPSERCERFGTLTGYKPVSHKPDLGPNAEIESSGLAANGTRNN